MGLLDTIKELFGQESDEEPPEEDSIDDESDDALDDGESPEPESDTPESDTEQRLTELQTQVKNLESQASQAENKARALEKQIGDMETELENIDDRTFKLLGIYDALVARINPLVRGSFDDIPSITDKRARDIPDDTTIDRDQTTSTPEVEAEPSPEPEDDYYGETDETETSVPDDTEHVAEPVWEADPVFALPAPESADSHPETDDEHTDTPMTPEPAKTATDAQPYQTPEMDTFPLDTLNTDIKTEELLSEWVLMLLHQGGLDGLFSSLQHYVHLGWMHDDIVAQIEQRVNN
jgi:archaellum component FlaD/FlaE